MICHSFPLDESGRNEKQMTTLPPTHCHVNNTLVEILNSLLRPCSNTVVRSNISVRHWVHVGFELSC